MHPASQFPGPCDRGFLLPSKVRPTPTSLFQTEFLPALCSQRGVCLLIHHWHAGNSLDMSCNHLSPAIAVWLSSNLSFPPAPLPQCPLPHFRSKRFRSTHIWFRARDTTGCFQSNQRIKKRHTPTLKGQRRLPEEHLQGEEDTSFAHCTWCSHQMTTKARGAQRPCSPYCGKCTQPAQGPTQGAWSLRRSGSDGSKPPRPPFFAVLFVGNKPSIS